MLPPLGNQYLNLTKNTSLAIAVGYSDIVQVGQTVYNQTGRFPSGCFDLDVLLPFMFVVDIGNCKFL